MKPLNVRLIIVFSVIIFLLVVIFYCARQTFILKAHFQFVYFEKINGLDIKKVNIPIPIYSEINTKKIGKDMETFIIFNSSLTGANFRNGITVNKHYVSVSELNNFDCSIYYPTCAVIIPNDFISSNNVSIDLGDDLFALNQNKPTFIGILFYVNRIKK